MKKFTAVMRNENGTLTENAFFAEKSDTVKALEGFITITKTERVKHPSPENMTRVLLSMGVDLVQFYTLCNDLETAQAADKTSEE